MQAVSTKMHEFQQDGDETAGFHRIVSPSLFCMCSAADPASLLRMCFASAIIEKERKKAHICATETSIIRTHKHTADTYTIRPIVSTHHMIASVISVQCTLITVHIHMQIYMLEEKNARTRSANLQCFSNIFRISFS